MPKLDNDFRKYFERKEEGEKVLAKCKSCKFAATPCLTRQANPIFT